VIKILSSKEMNIIKGIALLRSYHMLSTDKGATTIKDGGERK